MSDLLALLGAEWAPPAPVVKCSTDDRLDATHGCPSCERPPTTWSDVLGGYIDGMGRLTRCGYCHSCIASGRTTVRDPWTDRLVGHAPCPSCNGTGWLSHAWDCGPKLHQHHMDIKTPIEVSAWGVTFDGRTVFPTLTNHANGGTT